MFIHPREKLSRQKYHFSLCVRFSPDYVMSLRKALRLKTKTPNSVFRRECFLVVGGRETLFASAVCKLLFLPPTTVFIPILLCTDERHITFF